MSMTTGGNQRMKFRIGIDVGGTFTDFVVIDDTDQVRLWKEESSRVDPLAPIEKGLHALAAEFGRSIEDFMSSTELLVHGTTIATNTVIERDGPKMGLLCTKGFRDALQIRDGFKPERFNIHLPPPRPFVDRYLRLGIRERIEHNGAVKVPLEPEDVIEAARTFKENDVGAVAIAL